MQNKQFQMTVQSRDCFTLELTDFKTYDKGTSISQTVSGKGQNKICYFFFFFFFHLDNKVSTIFSGLSPISIITVLSTFHFWLQKKSGVEHTQVLLLSQDSFWTHQKHTHLPQTLIALRSQASFVLCRNYKSVYSLSLAQTYPLEKLHCTCKWSHFSSVEDAVVSYHFHSGVVIHHNSQYEL